MKGYAMNRKKRKRLLKARGCTSKVRYISLMTAMNAAARTGLNWYWCCYCHGWHLTKINTPLDTSKGEKGSES